jgi:hypothetical protein
MNIFEYKSGMTIPDSQSGEPPVLPSFREAIDRLMAEGMLQRLAPIPFLRNLLLAGKWFLKWSVFILVPSLILAMQVFHDGRSMNEFPLRIMGMLIIGMSWLGMLHVTVITVNGIVMSRRFYEKLCKGEMRRCNVAGDPLVVRDKEGRLYRLGERGYRICQQYVLIAQKVQFNLDRQGFTGNVAYHRDEAARLGKPSADPWVLARAAEPELAELFDTLLTQRSSLINTTFNQQKIGVVDAKTGQLRAPERHEQTSG